MKRVRVMLSAILVMAIVAGALAFKVKTDAVCAYTKTITLNPPATTTCTRVNTSTFEITVTEGAASTDYASTTLSAGCPTTIVCSQSKTLDLE